jgi:hypothetical protein
MNWLGKIFNKKKKSYSTDNKYKLLIIDESAELIHQNLGIIDARADELLSACLHAYKEYKQLHLALVYIVDQCKHTNEIVFSTMVFSKIIERENAKGQLLDQLKTMFGNG